MQPPTSIPKPRYLHPRRRRPQSRRSDQRHLTRTTRCTSEKQNFRQRGRLTGCRPSINANYFLPASRRKQNNSGPVSKILRFPDLPAFFSARGRASTSLITAKAAWKARTQQVVSATAVANSPLARSVPPVSPGRAEQQPSWEGNFFFQACSGEGTKHAAPYLGGALY